MKIFICKIYHNIIRPESGNFFNYKKNKYDLDIQLDLLKSRMSSTASTSNFKSHPFKFSNIH